MVEAIVDGKAPGTFGSDPRGMTGIDSDDAVTLSARGFRDVPPFMRNGTQERLGASTGVTFDAGTGSGGVSRRNRERESRCRLHAWEGVGEVNPDDARRDLCADLRCLLL